MKMKSYKDMFEILKIRKEGALIPFITIGYPDYDTSLQIAKELVKAGADILELGLPFSDPIADGKTIQEANFLSIKNGMDTNKAFKFIKELRKYTDMPIGLLTYYNLIYQHGTSNFYSEAKKSGINSILIADVPIEEYGLVYDSAKESKLDTVLIISPLTNTERIKRISSKTTGFLYVVSRLGITGARKNLMKSTIPLIKKIKRITKKPLCVGFGISSPQQVKEVISAGADGAIVGSALIDLIRQNISNKDEMLKEVNLFVKKLKHSTKSTKNLNTRQES